jgi:hypothetical protein
MGLKSRSVWDGGPLLDRIEVLAAGEFSLRQAVFRRSLMLLVEIMPLSVEDELELTRDFKFSEDGTQMISDGCVGDE